jgi:outer membrane receptor protein involved in Fe transport
MTNNGYLIRRAIRDVLVANLAVTAVGAAAQAADAPGSADTGEVALSEVVVTGTRLEQPGLAAISPVTSVSSEEIKQSGVSRVEDLLNSLPQVMADQGGNISNGATGASNINLRGLGVQRTLVLINGRRLLPGDPTLNGNGAADVNNVPAALVERIDVLTGGASAVYGADAVAGVVNFVMNDHFSGVRVDVNGSVYNHDQHEPAIQSLVSGLGFALPKKNVYDGKTKDITFIMGGNFADDKGNVTAYAGFRKIDPVLQGQRDFSACSLEGGDSFACGGSSTSASGAFYTAAGKLTVGPGGNFIPFTDADKYNYGATNFYQRSDENYNGGLFGHFTFNDHATAYTEVMFMHDDSNAQVAASGAFIGSGTGVDATGTPTGNWNINCNNPLLSANEKAVLCAGLAPDATASVLFGRRNVEGGPRNDDLQHTSFRIVIGARGEIIDGWKYDAYAMLGRTLYSDEHTNDLSRDRLTQALQVVTDPLTGNIVCKANANAANGAPGCVPYNIWTPGGVTQAALNYVQEPSFLTGSTDERVVSAYVSGDLTQYGVKLPWATTGLGVSLGVEHRQEFMQLNPDEANLTNDVAGNGNPILPLNAGLSVREAFTEERLPLIQDKFLVKELSFETGYRYSDYNLGFKTNTYKFGVDWSPTSDARLRASYQRAVRAPNLQELYAERFVGLDGGTDPCASSTSSPPTATPAQCARTGVTAAQYGKIVSSTAGQYNGELGGTPTLKPETSDTVSFGVVLTPSFLPAFSTTIDYFNIKVKDVITSYGADYSLAQCLDTGNPLFCNLVHRSATGSLWTSPSGYITDITLNLGALQTKGIDFTANYALDMAAMGRLKFDLIGTYLLNFITEPVPGLGSYDCAGLYGNTCGVPAPKWRHKIRTTWETPVAGLDVSAQWRHVSQVKLDTSSSNPLLTGAVPTTDAVLGSREYIDLTASYMVRKGLSVRLGVNNVLDKDPPIIGGSDFGSIFVNGNTYPQVYDTLGRYLFVNVTADF